MSEARLTSTMLVSAIRRLAEVHSGFATLLRKGDDTSGAIVIELYERGVFEGLYERMPKLSGGLNWVKLGTDDESRAAYLQKRTDTDPDLTIVELDVPDATRFVPLLPSGT